MTANLFVDHQASGGAYTTVRRNCDYRMFHTFLYLDRLWHAALCFWAGLNSREPNKRAHAIEFLDNLLTGDIKRYVFPLFSDAPQAQRFRASLDLLGKATIDTESALRALLEQNDIWLTAATVWEIGTRGLTGFRDKIAELLNSERVVLREVSGKVFHGM
jgi:hypothetical protein